MNGMTLLQSDAWFRRWREVAKAGASQRERALQSIESELELESDEFFTARQKAEQVLITPKEQRRMSKEFRHD